MDDITDLQPPEEPRHEPPLPDAGHPLFSRTLAASLTIHLLASLLFLFPGGSSAPPVNVAMVDVALEEGQTDAPPAEPAEQPSEPPPETLPETAMEPPPQAVPAPSEEPVQEAPPEPQPAESPSPPADSETLRRAIDQKVRVAAADSSVLHDVSLGLSLSSGYFNSLNEGKTLREDIREYYFELLRKINESWWMLGGGNGTEPSKEAQLVLVISREGAVVDRMVLVSSGDPLYDRRVLQAVDVASPLPPLPQEYRYPVFEAPIRVVKPMNLLSFGRKS